MTFTMETGKKGIRIRREILTASNFIHDEALAVHGEEHAVVIIKERMTAMELVQTIQSLKELASGLLNCLVQHGGVCVGCKGGCPYANMGTEPTRPDAALLEEAGIPKNAKLDVVAEDGEVTFFAAEGYDLRDVPPDLLALMRDSHVCMDALEELLAEDEVIYGG